MCAAFFARRIPSALFDTTMQRYTRSVDDATSPIPDGFQLQFTDVVAEYARNLWINAVARRLGRLPLAVFSRPEVVSSAFAEEVHLLAETLADAILRECKPIFQPFSRKLTES
jgi:hypothetical protein